MNDTNNCVFFNFHGVTSFAVVGNGKIMDYLSFQYKEFKQAGNSNEANLTLKIVDHVQPGKQANAYSEGHSKFYIDNDNFYWELYGKSVYFKGTDTLASISTIYCEAGFNRIQLNMIIELFLRIQFNQLDIALVHAACISNDDGDAILIPAAKSTGKTALCLYALNSGYKFLSDDRVWLHKSGQIYAFPRYIVITKSNAKYFDSWQGKGNRIRTKLRCGLLKITPSARLKSAMEKILKRLIPFKTIYYKIQELYPSVKCEMQAELIGAVLLVREPDSDKILHPIESEKVEVFVSQVANLEWNYTLLEAASIHDLLFLNNAKWHNELQVLINNEKNTVRNSLFKKSNYLLGISDSHKLTDWTPIIEQVRNLIQSKNLTF